MLWLKNVFKIYIHANIHVAIAAMCLVQITTNMYGISGQSIALFVFFATVFSYNLIRFFSIDNNLFFVEKIKRFKFDRAVITLLSFVGAVACGVQLTTTSLIVLLPFVLLTFLYGVPLSSDLKKIRNIKGVKIFIIALSYTGITVFFPLVANDISISGEVFLVALQRFVFIILITLPFDIRDLNYDSPDLGTIPQVVGVKKTKFIGVVLTVIFVVLSFFISGFDINLLGELLIAFLSLLFLCFSRREQSEYYASFWVEGIPIFWLMIGVLL